MKPCDIAGVKEGLRGNLTIINGYPSQTGVGTYAQTLFDATESYADYYNFFGRPYMPEVHRGPPSYPERSTKWIGYVFPNLVTHKIGTIVSFMLNGFIFNVPPAYLLVSKSLKPLFRKTVSKEANKPKIFHYTDPKLYPFSEPEDSVVTIHDLIMLKDTESDEAKGLWFYKFNISKYKKFSHVLSVTKYVKKDVLHYGFEGKTDVVYPCVPKYITPLENKRDIRKQLRLPLDKILILSISSAVKRKTSESLKK